MLGLRTHPAECVEDGVEMLRDGRHVLRRLLAVHTLQPQVTLRVGRHVGDAAPQWQGA